MVANASIADRRLLVYTTLLSAAVHLCAGVTILRDEAWVHRLFGGHALDAAMAEVGDTVDEPPVEIETVVELPEEREEPPPLRLGIQESEADTKTWLGFAEAEEHLVPVASEVEQAALTPNDTGGMAAGVPDAGGMEPAPAPARPAEIATAVMSPPAPAIPATAVAPDAAQTPSRPVSTDEQEPDETPPTDIVAKSSEPVGAPAPKPEGAESESKLDEPPLEAPPVMPPPTEVSGERGTDEEGAEVDGEASSESASPRDEESADPSKGERQVEGAKPSEDVSDEAEPDEVIGPLPVPVSPPPTAAAPAPVPESAPLDPVESPVEGAPTPDIAPRSGRPIDSPAPSDAEADVPDKMAQPDPSSPTPAPATIAVTPMPEPAPGPAPGPTTGSGAAPGVGEGEALRRGVRSDKESPAASLKRAIKYRPGRPLAVQGLEVRTVEPRFPVAVRLTSSPRNAVVVVHFDRRGVVTRAEFLRDEEKKVVYNTGTSAMDEPLLTAIYQWRAKGRELERLPADDPEATVSFVMEIFLRN